MNILEIRLLKFGVHKLPLSKQLIWEIKLPLKLGRLIRTCWGQLAWILLEPSAKGQLRSNCRDEVLLSNKKFFLLLCSKRFFFFCRETLYNVEYTETSARQNYGSFHAKQRATRCELAVAPTIDLGQFLIILHFQWMPGLSLELFQLPFADLIDVIKVLNILENYSWSYMQATSNLTGL